MNFLNRIIRYSIDTCTSSKQKEFLKAQYRNIRTSPLNLYLRKRYFNIKTKIIKRYFSYTSAQLEHTLRTMGFTNGDTVLMHSSFKVHNGFQGGPQQVIDSVLRVIGPSGNLLMVSMPYPGSTFAYLKDGPIFDVRRSTSCMGIISEIFRTDKNVLRSLSPSHPILALGPKAKWIVADHEKLKYPCGKGSPFEKISQLNAKTLFFNVPSQDGISTFFHHLEDTFKEHLPVKLYDDEPLEATVIDSKGNRIQVMSYVFSSEARYSRNSHLLKKELLRNKGIRRGRIGNTELTAVDLNNVIDCARKIVKSGKHLYKARSLRLLRFHTN